MWQLMPNYFKDNYMMTFVFLFVFLMAFRSGIFQNIPFP